MIIKIIPETEIEKSRHKEIEFSGVKEFFIMGNKSDEDGHLVDFHEWMGGYRYLLGSLDWFYKIIEDERKENSGAKIASKNPSMIKKGTVKEQNMQVLEPKPFIAQPFEQADMKQSSKINASKMKPIPFPTYQENEFENTLNKQEAKINKNIFKKNQKSIENQIMPTQDELNEITNNIDFNINDKANPEE